MPTRRATLLVLNLLLVAAFFGGVEYFFGWQRLLAPWRQLALPGLLAAIAAQLLSYALRGLRIYWAEPHIPRGRWWACMRLILVSNAFNLLLPMRSGEASFPLLMRRWFGVDVAHAAGTLIWLRVLDLHVLAAVALLCIAGGWLTTTALSALLYAIAGSAVLAPLLLFALRAPLAQRLHAPRGRLGKLLARLLGGLPRSRRGLGIDLLLTWSAWGLKLGALGAVLAQFVPLPLPQAVLGAIGGDLASVLPIYTPGGFGVYESGVVGALAASPLAKSLLVQAAVNLHLFVFCVALLAGLVGLLGRHPQPAAAPAQHPPANW